MKKPAEMTPKSVCDLVMETILAQGFTGSNGPLKAFSEVAQISPSAAGMFHQRKFPGTPLHHNEDHKRRKYVNGKIFTLTRVCDLLGLDLGVCLDACGLPRNQDIIEQSRRLLKHRGNGLVLDHEDLDMLKKQVDIIG